MKSPTRSYRNKKELVNLKFNKQIILLTIPMAEQRWRVEEVKKKRPLLKDAF